jgi:hypothetical protein
MQPEPIFDLNLDLHYRDLSIFKALSPSDIAHLRWLEH